MTTPQDPNQPQGWGQQQPGQPTPDQPQQPQGQFPQGQSPQGQSPQGQFDQGQFPQGQFPQGQPQPGQAPQGQPWGDPQQAGSGATGQGAAPKTSGWKKRLPAVIAAVAVIAVLAILRNTLFGAHDPEVGDCIRSEGTSYETVDCDSNDAQYRVVGTDEDMTQAEFYADPDTCADVAAESAGVALWSGSDPDEDGKVFCAEQL